MSKSISRRQILGALGILPVVRIPEALAASASHNAPYDFADPYDGLAAYAKVRARLDGARAAFWYTSHAIGQPAGAAPELLFAREGISFQRVRIRPDRTLEAVFADCSYVLDPQTREVIEAFVNPYTKAVNKPRHQQPMVAPMLRITPEQAINTAFTFPPAVTRDMRVRAPIVSGDTVWFNDDILFFKPAGLEEEDLPAFLPQGAMAQTELVTYRARLSDVQNPALVSAPATFSITAHIPWSRWLDMSGQPGGILTRHMGRKLASLDEVPLWLRRRLDDEFPGYLTNPGI